MMTPLTFGRTIKRGLKRLAISVIGASGTLSLLFGGYSPPVLAALPWSEKDPAQSGRQEDTVLQRAARLREITGPAPSGALAAQAVQTLLLEHPQTPPSLLAAALNRLHLPDDVLGDALYTAARASGEKIDTLILLLVSDTYAAGGYESALVQLQKLSALFGQEAIAMALSRMDAAAGGPEFVSDETLESYLPLYDG